jgi:hypothetical protein
MVVVEITARSAWRRVGRDGKIGRGRQEACPPLLDSGSVSALLATKTS